MGGYAAQLTGWRTPLYILLGLSTFCLVVLFFLFPETSADSILLRRAQRLRKLTGNTHLRSKSEISQSQLDFSEVLATALLRPFRLFLEPMLALLDIYTAFVYS
jgi:DHA1 family multidrug resistance protein-like MFS transporter